MSGGSLQVLDATLADWFACKPEGGVLRAAHLGVAVDRAVARSRAEGIAPEEREAALQQLSAPEGGGRPAPFVALLRLEQPSASSRSPAPPELSAEASSRPSGGLAPFVAQRRGGGPVVHFLRFWRAMQEVWQCLGPGVLGHMNAAPLADEATALRDALLRHSERGRLTAAVVAMEVERAQQNSADKYAWLPLVAAVAATVEDRRGGPERPERLDEIASLLLPWLAELVEDYCRGSRAAEIRGVCDVLNCEVRTAATYLGASGWDLEAALRRAYDGAGADAARCQAAELRSRKHTCPICVGDFSEAPVVTTCCSHAICAVCIAAVTDDDGIMTCPFCRKQVATADAKALAEPRSEDLLRAVLGAPMFFARALSRGCGSLLEEREPPRVAQLDEGFFLSSPSQAAAPRPYVKTV